VDDLSLVREAQRAAERIAREVAALGGRVYYVGGCVRDSLMGISSRDLDIEVHGIPEEVLEGILSGTGSVRAVGRSFGIYSLGGIPLDIALPRSEIPTGRGHRDFEIRVDPYCGTKAAAMRRDFTVNSIMKDVLTGKLTDHFGGRRDIRRKTLRYVDAHTFPQDPLRVLRAARFASRLGFSLDRKTKKLCCGIDLSVLSPERVRDEMMNALLYSDRPSVFFYVLRDTGRLSEWFPEIGALSDIPQDPLFHPEGDVFVHTMAVLDAGASLRGKAKDPESFMLSCLCHDLGKALTTTMTGGTIHSYGHEKASEELAGTFLSRLRLPKAAIRDVMDLVLLHMKPTAEFRAVSKIKKTNALFDSCRNPEDLILLAEADYLGCGSARGSYPGKLFLQMRLDVYRETMSAPFLGGGDLIRAGIEPGKDFSEYLAYAHKLRLAGEDRDSQLRQTLAYIKQKEKKR